MEIYVNEKENYQMFLTNVPYAANLRDSDPETFKRFLAELAKSNPDFLLNSGFHSNELGKRNIALYRQLKEDRDKPERGSV